MKKPPFQECHASTLVELADGNTMAAWFGGSREGRNDVAIWGAIRYRKGWSVPMCLAKIGELPHWNPVLFRGGSGETLLFFKVGKNCSRWKTMVMRSGDNGQTWSEPEELVPGNIGGRGPVKNKCIELSDGSWLAPASSEIGRWQAFTDRSTDQGKSWQKGKLIAMPDTICGVDPNGKSVRLGVIQPTMWESSPGQVHMLLRSSSGRICRSDSADFGRTWCRIYETGLPNNNSGIDLVKLIDGSLLLAYNPVDINWGPRYPMTLALSRDNGGSWQKMADADTEPREYSYPAMIATSDGGVALTYTWGRKNIVYVRIAVEDITAWTDPE